MMLPRSVFRVVKFLGRGVKFTRSCGVKILVVNFLVVEAEKRKLGAAEARELILLALILRVLLTS